MKYLLALFLSTTCHADYKCLAAANENLGFTSDIFITVAPEKAGGQIIGQQRGRVVPVAIIAEVVDMRDTKSMAFGLLLKFYGDSELSGLTNPNRVNRILRYTNRPVDRESTSVIRFFEGSRQVGGTFVLRGDAIACLPI
jgi:hypothetical protein